MILMLFPSHWSMPMMARRSLRSDEFQYRPQRPLLSVDPFLRAAEDGEDREGLDPGQILGPELAHELFDFPHCAVVQQHVSHRVDGCAAARIL
jgi:hypothetical protein